MKKVCRVLISNGERVLIGLRSSKTDAKKWDIIGGKPDDGEADDKAALRETFEETGLILSEVTLWLEDIFGDWVTLYFLAQVSTNTNPMAKGEHSELRWVSKHEYQLLPMAFNHAEILKQYFATR